MQFLTEEFIDLLDTEVSGNNQTSHSIISFRMAARVYPEIFSGTIKPHTEKEYDEYRLYASRCLIIAASEAHRHIVQEKEKRKGNRKKYWKRPSLPTAPVIQDSPIRSTYHAAACARGKHGEHSLAHMEACVDWSFVRLDEDNFRSSIKYDIMLSNEESIEELPLDALDISGGRLPITFRNHKINSDYEPHWQFWRDWYQGFLDGKPLDWNLQRAVALIPDADWEKGPAHIAGVIEEIRKKYDRKPIDPAKLHKQVAQLIAHPEATQMTANGLARQIDDAITQFMKDAACNSLPDEFTVLERLPALLRAISKTVVLAKDNSEREKALEKQIQVLAAEIISLKDQLIEAKANTLTGVLSKNAIEQAGKSIGDWKMWGAIVAGSWVLLGQPVMGDVLDEIPAAVCDVFPEKPMPAQKSLAPTFKTTDV